MKSMEKLIPAVSILERITSAWGPLLKRMLDVVDAFAKWNEEVIEQLYIQTGGEVDKPFPAIGDILSIYLVENRLYKGSPQGWFIVEARRFQRMDSPNGFFWCSCTFNADVMPLPDFAVPWKENFDPWLMREKLSNRSVWIRLSSHERDGCSYYNLSDWIKAKRAIMDSKRALVDLQPSTARIRSSYTTPQLRARIPDRRKPARRALSFTPKKRKRRREDEYVYNDSDTSSSSDVEPPDIEPVEDFSMLFPLFTTGKMSSGFNEYGTTISSAVTSVSSTPKGGIQKISATQCVREIPKCDSIAWNCLREETQQAILSSVISKVPEEMDKPWVASLAKQLEHNAVFNRACTSQDRYEGLSRSVLGILQRFECLTDAVETLIPVSDELRCHLQHSQRIGSPDETFIDRYGV